MAVNLVLIKYSTFLVPMRLWETPVPIPNTTVKTQAADGTALETVWKSRWAPDQKKKNRRKSAEYRTGIGSEFCWNKAGTEEIR